MHRLLIICFVCLLLPFVAFAGTTVIFSTGFEQSEGYLVDRTLVGQQGWMVNGTGGEGVRFDISQQAYVGYAGPLSDSETSTTVWKPLNYGSVPSNSIIKFSVDMVVFDSTSQALDRDEFRWSIYNTNDERLFSLIFDNVSLGIFTFLSDETTYDTGFSFRNFVSYRLVILMDFSRNVWNASLNGLDLNINSPISVNRQVPLTLSCVPSQPSDTPTGVPQ